MAVQERAPAQNFPPNPEGQTYTIEVESGKRYRDVFVDTVGSPKFPPPAWTTLNGVVVPSNKVVYWWNEGSSEPQSASQKEPSNESAEIHIPSAHEIRMERVIELLRQGLSWHKTAKIVNYSHPTPMKSSLKNYLKDQFTNLFDPDFRP